MSKTIIMVMCSCFCALLCEAQIKKSTVAAHSSVGDLSSIDLNNNSTKQHKLNLKTGVGFFIKDNWDVGLLFNYIKEDVLMADNSKNSNTLGIAIYSNYYFGNGKLKPYITFQTGWRQEKGSVYNFGGHRDINRSYFYADPGAGLNWNIKSNFSLFTEATYSQDDLNLSLGIRLFFNKKKNTN